MNNYLATYKFYNKQRQRLSIFGREVEGKLEIYILRCSRKEERGFSKKRASHAYSQYLHGWNPQTYMVRTHEEAHLFEYHPEIVTIDIAKGDKTHYTFMNYCYRNFYKLTQVLVEVVENAIVKYDTNGEIIEGISLK